MKFIKNIDIKKALFTLLIILLSGYVLWDISLRLVNNFRMQGYEIAVMEMARQAQNEECHPFELFVEEESIGLINIDCLQEEQDAQGMPMEQQPMMPGGEMEMDEEMVE